MQVFDTAGRLLVSQAGGGGGAGSVNFSAGTESANLGSVVFSNSNGVSFGLNAGTITASAVGGGGGSLNVSGGSTSGNLDSIVFTNANGVSFQLNGSTLSASVQTNYLTTAMASNRGSDFVAASAAFAGTSASGTIASNGISVSIGPYITTAMLSNAATISNINVSGGTTSSNLSAVKFIDSNGVSWSLDTGSKLYATVKTDYLTTAALSNHSHGVSFTSGSVGFQTLSFTNSNGISFNSGTQGIFGSHNAITTGRASNDGVGLNTAQTNVTWTVNSSGISINASGYAGTGFTSTTTAGTAIVGTHNTAGLSVGVPAFLTTAMQSNAATLSNVNFSAGTTSSNASAIKFADSNGVSFGLNTGSVITATVKTDYLTTAMQSNAVTISNINVSAGTTSQNLSKLTFDNAGGITFGLNGSVITAVAPAGAPSPVNFSAGTTSNNLASVIFANSNGISFGLNTGVSSQSITASHNGLTTARASNDGIGLNTAQTNVTWTVNSNGLSFNAVGYAGTSTGFTGANMSLSMTNNSDGLAISASVAAPGGGAAYTALSIQNRQLGASTTILAGGGQNSLWLAPLRVAAAVSASTILAEMVSYSGTITSAATAQAGHTVRVGIWSQLTDPASTSRFDTWWTGAASMTFWNSGTSSVSFNYSQSGGNTTSSSAGSNLMTASVMGVRHIILPIGSTMPAGLYVIGLLNSTSTAGYSAAMSRMAGYFDNPMSIGAGTFNQATNASIGYEDGGTYLTTTGALPSTLALNQIGQVNNVMPFFKIGAI